MKVKFFITATNPNNLMVERWFFAKGEKAQAIAQFKAVAHIRRDAEFFTVDSDDDDIVYNHTAKYI